MAELHIHFDDNESDADTLSDTTKDDDETQQAVDQQDTKVHTRRRLVDQLWWPLRAIAKSPQSTAIIWLVINMIFIGLSKLINTMINTLTLPGFLVLCTLGVYLLGVTIARALTYPIYVPSMLRSLERNAAVMLKRKFESVVRRMERNLKRLSVTLTRSREHKGKSHHRHVRSALEKMRGELAAEHSAHLSAFTRLLKAARDDPELSSSSVHANELLVSLERVAELHEQVDLLLRSVAADETKDLDMLASTLFKGSNSSSIDLNRGTSVSSSLVSEASPEDVDLTMKTDKDGPNSPILSSTDDDGAGAALLEALAQFHALLGRMVEPPSSVSGADSSPASPATTRSTTSTTANMLTQAWTAIKTTFRDYQQARKPYKGLASIHFVRCDLVERLKAEQAWVTAKDGSTRLDTMLIRAQSVFPTAPQHADNRTIILCNANAVVYEYAALQSQWIDLYTKLGFNILLYNYRGYGRSQGKPTPSSLCIDIESIAAYLCEKCNVKHGCIGVHGESIGGVVTTHLGRHAEKFGVFLVVADRSFSSLPSAAQHLMGNWASIALRRLVRWEASNVEDYINTPSCAYKVITCDPEDEIIAHLASLKVGVAECLIEAIRAEDAQLSSDATTPVTDNPVSNLATMALGHCRWLISGDDLRKFVLALDTILHARRDLYDRNFAENLPELNKVLWYLGDQCGSTLGTVVHACLEATAAARASSKPLQVLAATVLPTDADELDDTVTDNAVEAAVDSTLHAFRVSWVCAVVWGPTTSACRGMSHADIARLSNTHNVQLWRLGGENGFCGARQPVALDACLRVVNRFMQDFDAKLEQFGLAQPMSVVFETLGRLEQAFETNKRLGNELTDRIGHLIPLQCGHNGHMSQSELEELLYHVLRAVDRLDTISL